MKLLFTVLMATCSALVFADDFIFAEGSEWQVVSDGHQFAEGMAWDREGNFYFTDVPKGHLFKIDASTGIKTLLDDATGRTNGIAMGPDEKLYGCSSGDEGINVWNLDTLEKRTLGKGVRSNDIAILDDGTIFFTDPSTNSVWQIDARTNKRSLATSLEWRPNGIGLSLDQSVLLVAAFDSGMVYGFPIDREGSLSGKSHSAYKLAIPSNGLGRLDGMQVLRDGRLIIGTALGLQVAVSETVDSPSNDLIIVPSPDGRPRCNYARISPDNQWIYTAYKDDILRRKLKEGFGL